NRTELPLHDLGLSRLAAGTWRLIQILSRRCKKRKFFFRNQHVIMRIKLEKSTD
ncbi:hypothetical protein HMPREF1326_01856, partial [Akkermansia sp. KLE1605]